MLKRTIKYTDYNDQQVAEDFYFNLSKAELLEMVKVGGLDETIQRIIATENVADLILEFKKIILMSIGVKSEDGRRFIKNDTLRQEFEQTAAYSELFMELSTDADAASTFMNAVIPKDMAGEISSMNKGVSNVSGVLPIVAPSADVAPMTMEEAISRGLISNAPVTIPLV